MICESFLFVYSLTFKPEPDRKIWLLFRSFLGWGRILIFVSLKNLFQFKIYTFAKSFLLLKKWLAHLFLIHRFMFYDQVVIQAKKFSHNRLIVIMYFHKIVKFDWLIVIIYFHKIVKFDWLIVIIYFHKIVKFDRLIVIMYFHKTGKFDRLVSIIYFHKTVKFDRLIVIIYIRKTVKLDCVDRLRWFINPSPPFPSLGRLLINVWGDMLRKQRSVHHPLLGILLEISFSP